MPTFALILMRRESMTFSTKVRSLGLLGLGATLVLGCSATKPPRELADARAALQRVQADPAAQLAPEKVSDANTALNRAEAAYAGYADDLDVRTMAYVAERKAEIADVQAHEALDVREQAMAEQEIQQAAHQQLSQTQAQLSQTTQQLQRTQAEKEEIERKAREALAGLTVKLDERGTVITLPGQVLFMTGKASLRPPSRQKLNQVAEALKGDPSHSVIVEGHTDSTGTDAKNERLSQQRAEAVKDYLVSRGVKADRVTAKGFGKAKPIATNATPEGRAENRRVEIIIESSPSR